ncbi:MAG: MBL fold metallo-hydrolase [Acidiferrobacterales bacterium]|nr:MBL fold metallo-hydrolase [Acidiferrobacterales bacterium]
MEPIAFQSDFSPRYGELVDVAPNIRRIVANNPGPFTGPGTGTYIVGAGEVAVIDPGPMMPEHVDAMLKGLGDEHISHIIVTHTHTDHSPASRLLQQKTGAGIFAFGPHSEKDAGALEGGVDREFQPDFIVADGEMIEGQDWLLEAIHTPGHCSNHLCFAMKSADSLFCGDQLMAWATPVILPPDGSISEYIDSLERLAKRSESIYYPTHGLPIDQPQETIIAFIRHRLDRIDQVANALGGGLSTLSELREHIYHDIPSSLYAGAELSLLASLEYLEQQGKVDRGEAASEGRFWRLR